MFKEFDSNKEFAEFVQENAPVAVKIQGNVSSIKMIRGGKYHFDRLYFKSHALGKKMSRGRLHPVYYLPGQSKEEVLRVFLDENPTFLKGPKGSITQILSSVGSEWAEAWKNIAHEYEDQLNVYEYDTSHHPEKECPFCGESVGMLPDHLVKCAET